MPINEPQRLINAKQRLETIIGQAAAFQTMVRFNTLYEQKNGSALTYCLANQTDKTALDKYTSQEQQTKARYYEMVAHRYDRQLLL